MQRIDILLNFLCSIIWLDIGGISNRSLVTKSMHTRSHGILHKFSAWWIVNCLISTCATDADSVMRWILIKIVIVWHEFVRIGWWYRLFPCTESCICLWVLLNLMLAGLRAIIWSINATFLLKWGACLLLVLGLRCSISCRMCGTIFLMCAWQLYFLYCGEIFLTCLLSFLHCAFDPAST